MAETFLSPVIQKLVDLLFEEAKSLKGVHKQVKSVKEELEIIEPFLRDAEAKLGRGEVSDSAKVWLKQLRDVADRIEDVVDEYTYRLQHQPNQSGFLGSLRKGGQWLKSLKPRHEIASEIRDVKESLRDIKDRGVSFGLRPFEQGSSSTSTVVDPRIGSLFVDNDELVGIESMSKELVGCLVEGESKRTVISLVGEGGIGKTTLARKVYNDAVEKGCFDHHVWVTVSQSYDINMILKILMNHICPTSREFNVIEEAFTLIRNSLHAKRYVIVFDDVWQTDFWSVISHALPSNDNNSRILVTTRKLKVVDSFRQISCIMIVQELKTWSREQAWELFCKKAFSCCSCPSELEKLSHGILNKCQGLPLAIVAIAGLLSKKEKSKVEWERVLSNLDHEFEENRELSNVSKVLLLSYHDLPYHLKSCLLYFGIFPEDTSLYGERLCRLWIAEGLIQSRKDMVLEQIAEEYLIELISRNLVSSDLTKGLGKVCKVHDLIYKMILRRNDDQNFFQILNKSKSSFNRSTRRLSIHDITENVWRDVKDSKIRSVILYNTGKLNNGFVVGLVKQCKLLKVLEIRRAPIENLPDEVGKLLHLKYLSLNQTKVKILPKSIGELCNLQTLDVRFTSVRELPVEINKLRKLRHILAGAFDRVSEYSVGTFSGVRIHEGIGRLEELQTLHRIEANPRKVGFVKELQKLTNVRSLGISKVTAGMGEALSRAIEKMNNLEELCIYAIREEEVLDLKGISSPALRLSFFVLMCRLRQLSSWITKLHNVHSLELRFSRLIDEPLKCLKGLPNLAFLKLYESYDGNEMHFEEDGFQKLKQLNLLKHGGLETVKIDRGAMPLLRKLEIGPWPQVKEMPYDIQHLTNLKSLDITDMPREFVRALQPNGGSEYWKIMHIPNVDFGYYTGRGTSYDWYKLGSSQLLQHLKELK